MKKIIIDGKEYFQMEDSDIEKLPKMIYPQLMLFQEKVLRKTFDEKNDEISVKAFTENESLDKDAESV